MALGRALKRAVEPRCTGVAEGWEGEKPACCCSDQPWSSLLAYFGRLFLDPPELFRDVYDKAHMFRLGYGLERVIRLNLEGNPTALNFDPERRDFKCTAYADSDTLSEKLSLII